MKGRLRQPGEHLLLSEPQPKAPGEGPAPGAARREHREHPGWKQQRYFIRQRLARKKPPPRRAAPSPRPPWGQDRPSPPPWPWGGDQGPVVGWGGTSWRAKKPLATPRQSCHSKQPRPSPPWSPQSP